MHATGPIRAIQHARASCRETRNYKGSMRNGMQNSKESFVATIRHLRAISAMSNIVTNADCPNSYCQIDSSKPGPYVYDSDIEGCKDFGHCNGTCGAPLIGTWRGIEISSNFVVAMDFGLFRWVNCMEKRERRYLPGTCVRVTNCSEGGSSNNYRSNTTVSDKGIFKLDSMVTMESLKWLSLHFLHQSKLFHLTMEWFQVNSCCWPATIKWCTMRLFEKRSPQVMKLNLIGLLYNLK